MLEIDKGITRNTKLCKLLEICDINVERFMQEYLCNLQPYTLEGSNDEWRSNLGYNTYVKIELKEVSLYVTIEEGLLFLTKIKKIYYDSLSIEIYVECNLGEKSIYVSLNKKNELVYKDSIYRGREKKVGKKELELLSKRLSGLTIVFNRNRVGRDDFFKCIIPIKRELVKNGKYQMKWIVGSIDYLERYPNLKEMNKGYYSYRAIMERIGDK